MTWPREKRKKKIDFKTKTCELSGKTRKRDDKESVRAKKSYILLVLGTNFSQATMTPV